MSKDDITTDTGAGATLSDAYDKVSDKVSLAYASAREATSHAAHSTATRIEGNPLVAIVGGLALGAIVGALVPRGDRESALLKPLGGRLNDAARAAIDAGRTAGVDAFADAGLGANDLRAQATRLVEQALGAAGAAGIAALGAAREASAR